MDETFCGQAGWPVSAAALRRLPVIIGCDVKQFDHGRHFTAKHVIFLDGILIVADRVRVAAGVKTNVDRIYMIGKFNGSVRLATSN